MAVSKADTESQTPGGLPQEKVEDRPAVSTVTPDRYPEKDRKDSNPGQL